MASEVGQVSGLKVNGTEAGMQVTIQDGTPQLSWTAASKANAYYVTVQEVGGTTNAFAAFTADASLKVEDKLPLPSLSIPTFDQSSGTLVYGKNYLFSVSAVRTETNNLTSATAFNVAPAETNGKISYF